MSHAVRELVILVGMPGAGKTTYCREALHNYERISQDDGPHSYRGVLRRLEELIGHNVPLIVIDRTNPMLRQREEVGSRARIAGYRVKIIYFRTSMETCRERIVKRSGHPTLTPDHMHQAIGRYVQDLNPPTADECDELIVLQPPTA